jgi:hypothetical protein
MTTDTGAPVVGVQTEAEANAKARREANDRVREVRKDFKVGVKSEDDVAASAPPVGPLIRYGQRPPVREGVKVGYRGEDEGIVIVSDGTRAETKASILEAQAAGPFAPVAKAATAKGRVEPDYLANERPGSTAAASGDGAKPAPTKAELLARAAELGIEGVGTKTKNDDIAAAIAEAEAAKASA